MLKPRRSLLYMPATNARAIEKARALPVDALALDLEDSIAPEKKGEARTAAVAAVKGGGFGRREVVIRTNGPDTEWFAEDFAAALSASPDAILVPKVETPEILERIAAEFAGNDSARTRLWIMVETPLAVLNAHPLAAASKSIPKCRLETFVLGNNDIQKVTRSLDHPERLPLLFAIQSLLMAARAYGLSMLDGVYNNFKDLDGFRRECEQGRLLGMDGKSLIHPSQIDIANTAFGPSAAEIGRAQRIIAAFSRPEAQGKGAINFEGEMVELLHLDVAKRTVALAGSIASSNDRS